MQKFQTFEKIEKIKMAEKHLFKYIFELKRHFDFSDYQILFLLENSLKKLQKNQKKFKISDIFVKIIMSLNKK